MRAALLRRKDVRSWCLYDWANSAFVTSVVTVILPVYFLTLVPEDGPVQVGVGGWSSETSGPALWTYVTGLYMLAAGLVCPVLGAIADYTRGKRKFLGFCVVVGSLLTCSLFFVTQGRYQLCSLLFIGAAFLWSCGNLFY
ncbi:MAG: MFS transporter, partial [Planctomycetota bacterium]